MFMEKILNTLIWAAILQGLLLGLHYFFSKRHSSLANKLLGLFLLAFVFEALTILPLGKIEGYSTSGYFSLPEVKLFFPVLFLNYILEKVGRSRLYNPFLKSHYILALCFVAITFFNGLLYIIDGRTIYQLFEFQVIEVVFMIMQYYAFFLTIAAIVRKKA